MKKTERIIILKHFPFRDKQYMVEALSKHEGKKSFVVYAGTGKKSRMRRALLRPLHLLEIEYTESGKYLPVIKEMTLVYHYKELYRDIKKMSVALLLAEILRQTVRANENGARLFSWVENQLIQLDQNKFSPDFHLFFLLELARFLGFSLYDTQSGIFFDGETHDLLPEFTNDETDAMKQFIEKGYTHNSTQRRMVLAWMEKYFRFHLDRFEIKQYLDIYKKMLHE